MALFVWVAMATALWHFTIFVPDRFPGGMVGAFACANAGALAAGLVSNGLSMPALALVSHADAVIGAVGGLLGLGAAYAYGARRDGEEPGDQD
jgi:hypothetical protein